MFRTFFLLRRGVELSLPVLVHVGQSGNIEGSEKRQRPWHPRWATHMNLLEEKGSCDDLVAVTSLGTRQGDVGKNSQPECQ